MNFSTGGKRANIALALTPRKEKAQPGNGDRLGLKGFNWIGDLSRRRRSPLLLAFGCRQLQQPGVRGVGDLGQDEQIAGAEAHGALPLAFVGAVETLERNVEEDSVFAIVPPDRGFDAADSDFLGRLNFAGLFLSHDSAPFVSVCGLSVHLA